MDQPKNDSAIVILAAGGSARLGTPKQLLKYNDESLLQRAINTAKGSEAGKVILVLGASRQKIISETDTSGTDLVVNPDWQSGMSSSIVSGIKALKKLEPVPSSVILMVCDQPFVTSALLNTLIAEHRSTNKQIIACAYEGVAGTPVLFSSTLYDQLLSLEGDAGAKKIIMANADKVATVTFELGATDVDTLDDYKSLINKTS
ncbi:MAG: nucleotidyltransferase family protein [Bacteroidetes bacterium]|nr:nucleotidyltransferase family protein [Bacteroidota bacterium]